MHGIVCCMTNQISNKHKQSNHRGDNRERLITAGYEVLAEKGFEGTTVKEIAQYAGVSPGLFHYYFVSKDELLLAVVQEAGERFKKYVLEELRGAVARPHFLRAILTNSRENVKSNMVWYRLRYELYALGLRNEKLLPSVGTLLARIRQEISQTIQSFLGNDEKQAEAIAAVILACYDGLALQQLAQADLDLTAAYDLVYTLVEKD